ncbi:fluoride efflux transporter CrcB [Luteipulveratus sp. YIM 133132]|uniref:Fluoride-specific ion channel FluC n=1 Tax=Luteipulveratus flavus TaxID=3031728 RepID=A0ABT6C3T4_9MICO|nr:MULTISPECIES: fluoride efflux transporter CrcB [unclassified Luteipulveratus]MDE9364210.1 fluoride efflux transporter CrcB [Luteipulveratus sp. YIM 133132]MDF8263628.1 fluoride efflux transporter CrcB [Luteipulveratus sp. YIM 133296]
MSALSWLMVALGGCAGAPARYLIDGWVRGLRASPMPYGTLTVNLLGSFVLGAAAAGLDGSAYAFVGTGFCGALTTFSTFSFETWRLAEGGRLTTALLNLGVSVVGGVLAAALGWWLVA